jgi:tRNA modification GTPase
MIHTSLSLIARFRNYRMHNSRKLISSIGLTDTIFALSSGPITKSGVSVIRLSGPASLHCVQRLCTRYNGNPLDVTLKERQASLRRLYCPESGDVLDQSLVLWFPGPRSFTGEDVVELHVHGSRAVIVSLFSAFDFLDRTSGSASRIRPAERGEFTRRAFDNGRMDLTEVEGLADLLDADTALQRKQALRQMDGNMSKTYESWR